MEYDRNASEDAEARSVSSTHPASPPTSASLASLSPAPSLTASQPLRSPRSPLSPPPVLPLDGPYVSAQSGRTPSPSAAGRTPATATTTSRQQPYFSSRSSSTASSPSRQPSLYSIDSSSAPHYPARGASLETASRTSSTSRENQAVAPSPGQSYPPSLPPRPEHDEPASTASGPRASVSTITSRDVDRHLSLFAAANITPSMANSSTLPSLDQSAVTGSAADDFEPSSASSSHHIGLGLGSGTPQSGSSPRVGAPSSSGGGPPSLPPRERERQGSLGTQSAAGDARDPAASLSGASTSSPRPPSRSHSRPSLSQAGVVTSASFSSSNGAGGAGHLQFASGGSGDVVPTGFDEGALKALCEMDCGTPLLLDRMKQSMTSCREASTFLKKRAQIEEDYARSLAKLAKSSAESYSAGDGKAGSYVSSWLTFLRTHELVGENRLKFAAQLGEMSDELAVMSKEVDKNRKVAKDLAAKLDKGLQEQEQLVDRARARFDSAAEDLERLLVLKQGELITPSSVPHGGSSAGGASSKGRSFGKAMSKLKGPKNAAQYAKQEEEVRSRMGQASDSFRAQVEGMQVAKQEYFQTQLPKVLRTLKENVDELDLGTQYHLSRYSYLLENVLVTEGLTVAPVAPEDGPGLKTVVESIDLREDFKTYMQQYSLNWQMSGHQRGPRRDGPDEDGFSSATSPAPQGQSYGSLGAPQQTPPSSASPTFGVDLGEQMTRDGVEVPRVLEKCAEAIELHGLDSKGIYRLSGTTSRVQRLKAALDHDTESVDLLSEDNLSDINDIAAVLKLWFRELPEPLLTWELYHSFIDAAKIENDRLRHIRLHERINELPDPNYATLKFLMGHLDKVAQQEAVNQMSRSNLAIVFGPNLLGAPPPQLAHHFPGPAAASAEGGGSGGGEGGGGGGGGGGLRDMQWQCKCIETILTHFVEIFVE